MIATSFLSALVEEGSSWLVRFVDPRFAWLKLLSFLTLQAMLGFLLVGLLLFLKAGKNGARTEPRVRARARGSHGRPGARRGAEGPDER